MDPVIVEIKPPRLIAEAMAAAREAAEDDGDLQEIVEQYLKENTIRLGFVSATRRMSYKRGDAMQAAQRWLLGVLGLEHLGEVDFSSLDKDTLITWIAAWQAADIRGCLVSWENWEPPEKPEDWAEIPDYIFNPALSMAWEMNPQWAAERVEAAEGNF